MVLFNTKFILSDEFRNSKLIDAIRIRMGKGAKFRYDGQPTFMYEEDGKLLSVYNIEGVLAARILYSSKSDLITETYFVNKIKGGRSELSVTIENSAMLKPRGRKSANADDVPQVIRSLLWQELGGLDNGILTDDNATVIRKTDASEIRKSMIRMNQFINPVVYVSPESATGGYILDYNELASKLSGMAHVLVEANPVVSEAISFDGKPTDGGVGIFFPDGQHDGLFCPERDSLRMRTSCAAPLCGQPAGADVRADGRTGRHGTGGRYCRAAARYGPGGRYPRHFRRCEARERIRR